MIILDEAENELASSHGPGERYIGYPVLPSEIPHFVRMIKKTSTASEQELMAWRNALTAMAKKFRGR